jgi:hypothetical protein
MRTPRWLNRRTCHAAFALLFIALMVWIAGVPYEPMQMDLADATTNVIWTENYAKGAYHIPWDEWAYPRTQSSVVLYQGEYVVVNEKGPGLAMMLAPFYVLGIEMLFGPLMMALAALGTYLLGRRLGGWKVGLGAALIVTCNLTALVMWHRYYWTDAATMHLLVLAVALFVEAFYRFNGRSLDPREAKAPARKDMLVGSAFGILAGLSFGASISTRYATALVGISLAVYVIVFYAIKCWPELRQRKVRAAIGNARGILVTLPFVLGLLVVLVPLMQYNTAYFGGPFASGYDATSMMKFDPATGLQPRNTSEVWSSDLGTMLGNAADNFVMLLPVLVGRMPVMLLAPLGIWLLRRSAWLWLLLPWVALAFGTYLSLAWLDMYARIPDEVVWEPRYFLPALPPLAVLGAAALDWLAFRWRGLGSLKKEIRPVAGAIVAVALVGALALWGMAPAATYFASIKPGYQTPGGGPGPQPLQVAVVTTDQLLNDPQRYEGRFVRIEDARVTANLPVGFMVRSANATDQRSVPVRLDSWPADRVPHPSVGQTVEVQGLYVMERAPNAPPRPVLSVKWGTQDYARFVP